MITRQKTNIPTTIPIRGNSNGIAPPKHDWELRFRQLYVIHQRFIRNLHQMTNKYKNETIKTRKLMKEIAQLKVLLRAKGD